MKTFMNLIFLSTLSAILLSASAQANSYCEVWASSPVGLGYIENSHLALTSDATPLLTGSDACAQVDKPGAVCAKGNFSNSVGLLIELVSHLSPYNEVYNVTYPTANSMVITTVPISQTVSSGGSCEDDNGYDPCANQAPTPAPVCNEYGCGPAPIVLTPGAKLTSYSFKSCE
jgi:hypothetical protein